MRIHQKTTLAFLLIAAATAFGRGSSPAPAPPPMVRSPEADATASYNEGVRLRERAADLEKQIAAATTPEQKKKLEGKLHKTYEGMVRAQRRAVQNNAAMVQAHAELGYALRKTGDYEAALASYNQALNLAPNYAPAIEYRAEAYLGLNRVDEARQAYMVLFNGGDAAGAKQLGTAIQHWLDARTSDPAGVAPETIEQTRTWLAQRKEISAQTTSGGSGSEWR
jgi:tetratricopeptide (TPR) repeat protein